MSLLVSEPFLYLFSSKNAIFHKFLYRIFWYSRNYTYFYFPKWRYKPRMVLKITNLHILKYLPTCWLYLLERYTIDNQWRTHTASVRIERICEFCGKTFIAKTCKTRFCCKACNDKYYKELIRNDCYNAVTKEVKEEKKKRIRLAVDELEVIQAREFISLKQLAIYLGVSRKSIYTYMRIYEIPFYKLVVELLLNAKRLKRLWWI